MIYILQRNCICREKLQNSDKIKEKLNKWWYIPCSWIRAVIIFKMWVLFNLIYRFKEILIKILTSDFVDIDKLILKLYGVAGGPA